MMASWFKRTRIRWWCLRRTLTRREQEIPHFYKWWDELRYSRRLLDFCISQYYNLIINQSYSLKRI
jgi:hypothetical protein